MSLPKTYVAIVEKLIDLTMRGKVQWEAGGGADRVVAAFKSSTVEIQGPEWEGKVSILFRNAKGVLLESFEFEQDDVEWEVIHGLYSTARKQALRVEEVVKELDAELGELESED